MGWDYIPGFTINPVILRSLKHNFLHPESRSDRFVWPREANETLKFGIISPDWHSFSQSFTKPNPNYSFRHIAPFQSFTVSIFHTVFWMLLNTEWCLPQTPLFHILIVYSLCFWTIFRDVLTIGRLLFQSKPGAIWIQAEWKDRIREIRWWSDWLEQNPAISRASMARG